MAQTTYARYFSRAFAGMLGDGDLSRRIVAMQNMSTVSLPAGIGVIGTAVEQEFTVSGASTDNKIFMGVVLNTFARNPGDQSVQLAGSAIIMPNESANLLQRGSVWVLKEAGVAIAMGDPVYMRYSANGANTQVGAFRNDGDTSHAVVLKGCRWLAPAASADVLALVEVDVDATIAAAV